MNVARNSLYLFFCLFLITSHHINAWRESITNDCSRNPTSIYLRHGISDSGFEIMLTDLRTGQRVHSYTPDHVYLVTISNWLANVNFTDFYLAVSAVNPSSSPGLLMHFPHSSNTKNVMGCPNQIKARVPNPSLHFIRVQWQAPRLSRDSDLSCVEFKATVIGTNAVYYKDAGRLFRTLCPAEKAPKPTQVTPYDGYKSMINFPKSSVRTGFDNWQNDQQSEEQMKPKPLVGPVQLDSSGPCRLKLPPVIPPCCACGVAVYQITWETFWTKQFHWRNFPKPADNPHWSTIFGVSHNKNYRMYFDGGRASQSIQDVCVKEDFSALENEILHTYSPDILTVIKARGFEANESLGKRSALFAVNKTHHLVSFLSRLSPSPDWCTGLAQINLCVNSCSWPKVISLPLYPWDAGVRKGNSYLSPYQNGDYPREEVPDPICNIRPNWPSDNPFSSFGNSVAPVGNITIKLLRVNKDSSCVADDSSIDMNRSRQGDDPKSSSWSQESRCSVTDWSSWSKCSSTCGRGKQFRRRESSEQDNRRRCSSAELEEVRDCNDMVCPVVSRLMRCRSQWQQQMFAFNWSPWSPCNATCLESGVETRMRIARMESRNILDPECREIDADFLTGNSVEMRGCSLGYALCERQSVCSSPPPLDFFTELNGMRSSICKYTKTRYFFDPLRSTCQSIDTLSNICRSDQRRTPLNDFASWDSCINFCRPWAYSSSSSPSSKPSIYSSSSLLLGDEDDSRPDLCYKLEEKGRYCPERRARFQWHFDGGTLTCVQYVYLGCGGNANSFASEEECQRVCSTPAQVKDEIPLSYPSRGSRTIYQYPSAEPEPSFDKDSWQNTDSGSTPDSKCHYTPWGNWSACSKTCGRAMRQRRRQRLPNNPRDCVPIYPEYTQRSSCSHLPLTC